MTQNELKQAVAAAAAAKVAAMVSSDSIVGVGTGSTANLFIEALAQYKGRFDGAVASSEETAKRLKQQQIPVYDLNAAGQLTVYVDGADEITSSLFAIKGGGAALTREKIVTANAEQFICIADESKLVAQLGGFPLPVEVIPMARSYVARQMVSLGGEPIYRQDVVTDNGNVILDVHGLQISDPQALETRINNIVGVVCNGIFAHNPATLLLLGTKNGVKEYQ